jgi:GNAT superfamily N-acetyltransferase
MPPAPIYRRVTLVELPAISAFVQQVYTTSVAPYESTAGQATFARYTDATAIATRAGTNDVWVAEMAGTLVGALEVCDETHVALLFVDPAFQRQGIGRGLLTAALGKPECWPALTVNSTPRAVGAYARLGFQLWGGEVEQNGLRFQPMRRAPAPGPRAIDASAGEAPAVAPPVG